jgi:hypothetical protein
MMSGYGWLTGAHGLTLDNILSVEIVLASGDVVQACETENSDLFWAVRGAGACFGVVTSFVFQAHSQENLVWNGNLILPGTALKPALEIANNILAKENDHGKASIGIMWLSPPGIPAPVILTMLYYNGPEEEARSFFKSLLDLNPKVNTTKMKPWTEVNIEEPPIDESKTWRKVSAGPFVIGPFDIELFEDLWQKYTDFVAQVPDAKTTTINLVVHNPYATLRKGQSETSFPNRGSHANLMIGPNWTDEANDEVCREWCLTMKKTAMANRAKMMKQDETLDDNTKTAAGESAQDDCKL